MKKLLSVLAAVGLTATTGATVVACGEKEDPAPPAEKNKIKIQGEKAAAYIGESVEVIIDNAAELKNLKVVSDNEQIATVKIEESKVVIQATSTAGSAKLTLTADNCVDATIALTVKALLIIDFPTNITISAGQSVEIGISNYIDLTKLELAPGDSEIAAGSFSENKSTLMIKGAKAGTTKLTLTAVHAVAKVIKVTVK